jgi:transcriptional regulator with XRE-family HTH domain
VGLTGDNISLVRPYIKPLDLRGTIIESTVLDDWRVSKGWSLELLSKKLGITLVSVKRWCRGQTIPSLPLAFWIEYVTKGGVPVVSWMGTRLGKSEFNHYMQESGVKNGKSEAKATVS